MGICWACLAGWGGRGGGRKVGEEADEGEGDGVPAFRMDDVSSEEGRQRRRVLWCSPCRSLTRLLSPHLCLLPSPVPQPRLQLAELPWISSASDEPPWLLKECIVIFENGPGLTSLVLRLSNVEVILLVQNGKIVHVCAGENAWDWACGAGEGC